MGLAPLVLRSTLRRFAPHECAHCIRLERPIEFAPVLLVTQHGHACAVDAFELGIIVYPDTFEIRRARARKHGQSLVAQGTVVALVKGEAHSRTEG